MTRAVPLAALAGVLAVLGGWEALAALEPARLPRALARALARASPLLALGRDGRAPSAGERRRLTLLAAGTALAGGWLLGGPVLGAALAAAGPWAALAVVRARTRRHRAELARAAPAIARAVADALAAGHSIRAAVAAAGRDAGLGTTAGNELTALGERLALGEPTERVLAALGARARSRSVDVLVAAILLQRDAGGNLAGLLRELADAQEEAVRLERDARTATAQARFTGLLVCLLPAGAAALAELARPGYIGELLAVPVTAWLLACAVILQVGAFLLIRRLAAVRT